MTNSTPDPKSSYTAAFNQIALDYDNMDHLRAGAAWLVEQAALPPGARVLDVATGTGWAAIAAAKMVGAEGFVVGVDLAVDMLAQGRHKADRLGIRNIEFSEGDAERLDFPAESFDAVICAAGLFFVPDMLAALREWRRVVNLGGQVTFTSLGAKFRQPLADLFYRRLRSHGIAVPPPTRLRLPDSGAIHTLLLAAGLAQTEVRSAQRGYYMPSADYYWQTQVWSSAIRPLLLSMEPSQLEQFKAEHLAEVAALATPQGIWLDVPFHFARGWKQ